MNRETTQPTNENQAATGASSPRAWRGRERRPPLPLDAATRQGTIARLAFLTLGKDAAISFLNTHNARLGGRPLAIATESPHGEAIVELEVHRLGDTRVATAGFIVEDRS